MHSLHRLQLFQQLSSVFLNLPFASLVVQQLLLSQDFLQVQLSVSRGLRTDSQVLSALLFSVYKHVHF